MGHRLGNSDSGEALAWRGNVANPQPRCKVATTTGWSHQKPQVHRALDEAADAGLKVEQTNTRRHWGYIDCTNCTGRFWVWSTPETPDNHAKDIRRFIQRHRHPDERT